MTLKQSPIKAYIESKWWGSKYEPEHNDNIQMSHFHRNWDLIPFEITYAVKKLADNPKKRFCVDPYRSFADSIGYYPEDLPLPDDHKWSMSKILRGVIGSESMYHYIYQPYSYQYEVNQVGLIEQSSFQHYSLSEFLYLNMTLKLGQCGVPLQDVMDKKPIKDDISHLIKDCKIVDDIYVNLILDWKKLLQTFQWHDTFVYNVSRFANRIMETNEIKQLVDRSMKFQSTIDMFKVLDTYKTHKQNMVRVRA